MSDCHTENPCELCQQKTYDRLARQGARILREMELEREIQKAIDEARAKMPWWKRKLRRLWP